RYSALTLAVFPLLLLPVGWSFRGISSVSGCFLRENIGMSPEYQNPESHAFVAEASSAEGAGTVRVATPPVAEAEAIPEVAEAAFSTDEAADLAENPEQPGEPSRDVPHEAPPEQTSETIQQ